MLVVVACVFCALSSPGSSFAADWVLKRVTGTVYLVAPGIKALRAKTGMPLKRGYTLATRSNGRALLARGRETVMVSPNTTFALSAYRSDHQQTTLLQKSGALTVEVEKQRRPHFTVETPFFAAVVKGTKFTVSVRSKDARVSVDRGVVNVSDFASGDRTDLTAGQFASTSPASTVGLSVGGTTVPTVSRGRPRAPVFETPAVENVPTSDPVSDASNDAASSRSSNSPFGGNSIFNSTNVYGSGNSNSGAGNNSAGGNGNGNSGNSNAGGNGNGNSGNSNAGGNGNGNSGNSNAGGNGNGNSGNSNAGGNGNGNSGNSNAGGNGNGNSGNSNAGGNGNGNSGNSNAGGNGNGNSGNSNAGGNGNGNSGNSNAGGNSNGAGNSGNSNAGGKNK
ncbi:FecR domain-containing protein [Roseibium sp. CAU 1637]|uniref:FecR domain-containing protein n=1 Tax=Roseibium limicola TaxID=2816037 RepID=A0A939ENY8_9HYPH|nr:FecR domain-containing protein [Roseibium limicola]